MRCTIIYEDNSIIVVHKPAGLAVETARITEADAVTELRNYLKGNNRETYISPINRLDQPVEGLVLFALNEASARELSRQMTQGTITKIYKAIVFGAAPASADLTDHLLRNRDNLTAVVSAGTREAKRAHLSYEKTAERAVTLADGEQCILSTLRVNLDTGRHHQIRVQLAHAGYPIVGDLKYGSEESVRISKQICGTVQLAAVELSFLHPKTKKPLHFSIEALCEG